MSRPLKRARLAAPDDPAPMSNVALGKAFGGIIGEYVELRLRNGEDPEEEPDSELLRELIACLRAKTDPPEHLKRYAASPALPLVPVLGSNAHFTSVCENGHLGAAKWLKQNFPRINVRTRRDYAFRLACENGHLRVAQWLKQTFPGIDHRAKGDDAFRHACAQGHLEVAKWLKGTFPDIDHRAEDDQAFRIAARNGHLELVKWLRESFPELNTE